MRVLLVDDEKDARDGLKLLFEMEKLDVEVCGEADSVTDALTKLKEVKPQLVFLDVEMPGGTGFDLLEEINKENIKVIFITAYKEYAIQALRARASDYLLKPVDPDELAVAIKRVKEELDANKKARASKKIKISDTKQVLHVHPEEIIHIKGEGRYSEVVLTNNRKLMVTKNIGDFESELPQELFFRVHKSHLVNSLFILKIHNRNGGYAELNNGTMIEISRRKKTDLIRYLGKNGLST